MANNTINSIVLFNALATLVETTRHAETFESTTGDIISEYKSPDLTVWVVCDANETFKSISFSSMRLQEEYEGRVAERLLAHLPE